MFSGLKTEVAFSFTIISNDAVITQKIVSKVGTKFFGNAVFKIEIVYINDF